MDPTGLCDYEGMMAKSEEMYGSKAKKLRKRAFDAGYKIVKRDFSLYAHDIDDSAKYIMLASNWLGRWKMGLLGPYATWDRSNKTAAIKLHDALEEYHDSFVGNFIADTGKAMTRRFDKAMEPFARMDGAPQLQADARAMKQINAESVETARRAGTKIQNDIEEEVVMMAATAVGAKVLVKAVDKAGDAHYAYKAKKALDNAERLAQEAQDAAARARTAQRTTRGTSAAVRETADAVGDVGDASRAVRRGAGNVGRSPLVARIQAKLNLYPKVVDPRTGRYTKFPSGIIDRLPKAQRVAWTRQNRAGFIAEWHRRGYATPKGGWSKYDIHHIQPREFGGTNEFWNLVPVERGTHQELFNSFWREFLEL